MMLIHIWPTFPSIPPILYPLKTPENQSLYIKLEQWPEMD